jgi:hypothetical protein
MVDLQTISVMLAATSVVIASTYYILTLRNARLTRQAQLFNQVYQTFSSTELHRNYMELLNYEWEDYEDFERKYGSDNNLDSYSKRISLWGWFNGMGLLMQKKLIDPEMVYFTAGNQALWTWAKYEPIIKEMSRRYNVSDSVEHFEYLVNEMRKISDRRGSQLADIPETFARYVPE